MLLARTAERTLDVQYYIWHGDITGTLLLEELHEAADRGVRVRLLLDDNGTAGLDTELAALALHPQIEVRLFNPFKVRNPKWLGYITDFSRANRRMHNKSFTADSQASIVGGRNVGMSISVRPRAFCLPTWMSCRSVRLSNMFRPILTVTGPAGPRILLNRSYLRFLMKASRS